MNGTWWLVARLLAGATGVALVLFTIRSSIRTFVLPRSAADPIARVTFRTLRGVIELINRGSPRYERREARMAMFAPLGLLLLTTAWVTLVGIGYSLLFWATGAPTYRAAVSLSGSSLLTLGVDHPPTFALVLMGFSEGFVGTIIVALLISYLPTMYAAFARREAEVTVLAGRAGSPPAAPELLLRLHRLGLGQQLDGLWTTWEQWFGEVEENHTSLAALVFFRSPRSERSWVTSAGCVLDAAAITLAALEVPHNAYAELCLREGAHALRHISTYFSLPVDDAVNDGHISVRRDEFDVAYASLQTAGLPIRASAADAWRDFARARGSYDAPLLALCELTMAPYAPWSSDRSARPEQPDRRQPTRTDGPIREGDARDRSGSTDA